jgi:hypothetical protein
VQGGKLVIEPIEPKRRKRRYTLDELVGRNTPQNRHDENRLGRGRWQRSLVTGSRSIAPKLPVGSSLSGTPRNTLPECAERS